MSGGENGFKIEGENLAINVEKSIVEIFGKYSDECLNELFNILSVVNFLNIQKSALIIAMRERRKNKNIGTVDGVLNFKSDGRKISESEKEFLKIIKNEICGYRPTVSELKEIEDKITNFMKSFSKEDLAELELIVKYYPGHRILSPIVDSAKKNMETGKEGKPLCKIF